MTQSFLLKISSSINFFICSNLEGTRTLWLKVHISGLWFWTCLFLYLIFVLVQMLILTISVHVWKSFGCYYFPFIFVDAFYCYLVGIGRKCVCECVRVECLISARVHNISGWKGMWCSSQNQMFNFEPSYCREVLFRKSKLWRNLTEDKNNRRSFKDIWKYSILFKHWRWE